MSTAERGTAVADDSALPGSAQARKVRSYIAAGQHHQQIENPLPGSLLQTLRAPIVPPAAGTEPAWIGLTSGPRPRASTSRSSASRSFASRRAADGVNGNILHSALNTYPIWGCRRSELFESCKVSKGAGSMTVPLKARRSTIAAQRRGSVKVGGDGRSARRPLPFGGGGPEARRTRRGVRTMHDPLNNTTSLEAPCALEQPPAPYCSSSPPSPPAAEAPRAPANRASPAAPRPPPLPHRQPPAPTT